MESVKNLKTPKNDRQGFISRARENVDQTVACRIPTPDQVTPPYLIVPKESQSLQGARRSCVMPNILDESHRVKRGTLLLRRRISLALAPRPAPPNRPIRRSRNSSTAESRHQHHRPWSFSKVRYPSSRSRGDERLSGGNMTRPCLGERGTWANMGEASSAPGRRDVEGDTHPLCPETVSYTRV
ncbi:hypothetical protein CPAR01_00564 [Colletotrichum paranaense]|uniref:Uncharacterized protein n=1 Tax=Colletotrichum paranaense TaxID=1914294 RepID=A0ABQ9T486_9PEZI|nr:uncharacterized protein CPAR01_00564 [Colletotrichum paranaense]KAK1546597.1 hypothetical protein CPAR01_00564 [Colletotrichum paranaense]